MESHDPGKNAVSVSIKRRHWLKTTAVVTAGSFLFSRHRKLWAQLQSATSVQTENIRYTSSDSKINAFVSKPATGGPHPSLILIHDEAGLNDHAMQTATRFAEAGFYAFAPDLLSRSGGSAKFKSADQVADALNQLSTDQTAEDLRTGYSYLRTTLNPDAGASAVG